MKCADLLSLVLHWRYFWLRCCEMALNNSNGQWCGSQALTAWTPQ